MTNQSILNKIRAMLAKTVENGCTEAEAMIALEVAQRMMSEHEITADDLKLEGEKAIIELSDMRDPQNIRWKLCYRIAQFTETYSYGNKKSVKFAGLRGDVDFAVWLCEALAAFVHAELKRYMWANGFQSLQGVKRNRVINSFVLGCCSKINQKLAQLTEGRKVTVNSNALVVAKKL